MKNSDKITNSQYLGKDGAPDGRIFPSCRELYKLIDRYNRSIEVLHDENPCASAELINYYCRMEGRDLVASMIVRLEYTSVLPASGLTHELMVWYDMEQLAYGLENISLDIETHVRADEKARVVVYFTERQDVDA